MKYRKRWGLVRMDKHKQGGVVGLTLEIPVETRRVFKVYAAENGTSMQAVLVDYINRWIVSARTGGPTPEVASVPERPSPSPSAKAVRSARALRTTLEHFIHDFEEALPDSSESDTNITQDEPKLRHIECLVAELAAVLGGKYEPGVGWEGRPFDDAEAERKRDAARTHLQNFIADQGSGGSGSGGSGGAGGTGTGGKR